MASLAGPLPPTGVPDPAAALAGAAFGATDSRLRDVAATPEGGVTVPPTAPAAAPLVPGAAPPPAGAVARQPCVVWVSGDGDGMGVQPFNTPDGGGQRSSSGAAAQQQQGGNSYDPYDGEEEQDAAAAGPLSHVEPLWRRLLTPQDVADWRASSAFAATAVSSSVCISLSAVLTIAAVVLSATSGSTPRG